MKNVEHYKKGYFMPPVVDLSWAQKEYPDKPPVWCSVALRADLRTCDRSNRFGRQRFSMRVIKKSCMKKEKQQTPISSSFSIRENKESATPR